MRLKHRFLFVMLGALGSACLSLCLAISAEAQTIKTSVTIAQGSTPSPFQPETSSTDLSAVRAVHQQINDRYAQQAAAAAAAAEQRQQERQQQYNEIVQRNAAQAEADAKQAAIPTRTPFQPEAPPVAQAPTPPPFRPEARSVAQATPTPFQPEAPVNSSPEPETSIETPASSPTRSLAASAPKTVSSATPKSSPKATAKKLGLGELSFACESKNGTPATIAKVNNRELGVILWASTVFADRGFDPQTRCKLVSQRFEEYSKARQLSYLTTGKINGLPVVCVTSKADGACGDGIGSNAGLLFTLKPDSNGGEVLERLTNVLMSDATTPTDPLKQ